MASFTLIQSPQHSGIFLVVGPDGLPVSAINEFLLYLSHCGRSAYTLRSYARGLAHFFGWLHTTGRHLEDATPQVIEAYIAFFGSEAKGVPALLTLTKWARSIYGHENPHRQSTGSQEPLTIS